MHLLLAIALYLGLCWNGAGAELTVPTQYKTIQSAIDVAQAGDTVLVAAGTYRERLRLKPGINVRSAGDAAKGKLGLARAEVTILDHPEGMGPGVLMAEGAVLDGFTITGVGRYDEVKWKKHHATQGNDQKHEHIGEPGTAGIEVRHTCVVENNIVHHIGYTGIGITGAKGRKVSPRIMANICYRNMGGGIGSMHGSTAVIEANICFENFYAGIGHNGASPKVIGNTCYSNIRAGIGISEGSSPLVKGNRCYKNRRAGIGIRTGKNTRPMVEDNDCFENDMAGIGAEEDVRPVIRGNRCFKNKLAGIGCRLHAKPEIFKNICRENAAAGIGVEGAEALIVGNVCKSNHAAGIGVRAGGSAVIRDNQLINNALVAVGIRNRSEATLTGNTLQREGGMPPLMAVLELSEVELENNVLHGGGVAGVLLQGKATISSNDFKGNGPRRGGPPNFAVWVREGSTVEFRDNTVTRWRHALHSADAHTVKAHDNRISQFFGSGMVIKNSKTPAEVTGNTAFSTEPKAQAVTITGAQGKVSGNRVQPPKDGKK